MTDFTLSLYQLRFTQRHDNLNTTLDDRLVLYIITFKYYFPNFLLN